MKLWQFWVCTSLSSNHLQVSIQWPESLLYIDIYSLPRAGKITSLYEVWIENMFPKCQKCSRLRSREETFCWSRTSCAWWRASRRSPRRRPRRSSTEPPAPTPSSPPAHASLFLILKSKIYITSQLCSTISSLFRVSCMPFCYCLMDLIAETVHQGRKVGLALKWP